MIETTPHADCDWDRISNRSLQFKQESFDNVVSFVENDVALMRRFDDVHDGNTRMYEPAATIKQNIQTMEGF